MHTLTADGCAKGVVMPTVHVLPQAPAPATAAAPKVAPSAAPDTLLAVEEARLRGNAAFTSKRFDEAVSAYSEAIQLDEENGLIFGNRSAALLALDRKLETLFDAKQTVALSPALPWTADFAVFSVTTDTHSFVPFHTFRGTLTCSTGDRGGRQLCTANTPVT